MKKKLTAVLAAMTVCTTAAGASFTDTAEHWAESAIEKWGGGYGVVQGYEDGTFRPEDPITRGAFAGILDRFLHFQTSSPPDTFSDITGSFWEEAILKLHAAGVYLGDGGQALAGSTISRQQAVTMLGRAFQLTAEETGLPFDDAAAVSSYAAGYVAEFAARGYLESIQNGMFRPRDPLTRAELMDILDRMIHTLVQTSVTWRENVAGNLLISAPEGAVLEGIEVTGDLILAPGVQRTVTLVNTTVGGRIRNYGTGTVEGAPPDAETPPEPETPQDPEPERPTGFFDWTVDYNGRQVPVYRARPLNTFSEYDFYWNGDRIAYLGNEYHTRYGIDVSSYQGQIDWQKVAADNVDFAFVRMGFRGYGSGSMNTDSRYAENIRGALAAGLETGVYFFAQAITVEEAVEEADYVIALLRELEEREGLIINGPVAYDWEMHDATYRVYGTTPEMATACAAAFCERVKAAGYTPMVYAGNYVSYMKYDWETLAEYVSWYPEYKGASSERLGPTLIYHMDYWQFSSSCSVSGIAGRVDMNIQFIPRQ